MSSVNKFDKLIQKFQNGDNLSNPDLRFLQKNLKKIEDATISCGLSFRATYRFAAQMNDRISDILLERYEK